jgi:hypothetical protein
MDHHSYLIDRQHRFLLIGIVLLLVAVIFTLAEEAPERCYGMVSRAEEPRRFWWDVAPVLSRRHFLYCALLVRPFKLRHYPFAL